MECPRCDGKLIPKMYEGVEVDNCNKCNGHWLDLGEMKHILLEEEKTFTPELIESTMANAFAGIPDEEVETKEKCPHCQKLMTPMNYSYSSGVVIDRCLDHGIWLDHQEIEKLQAHAETWYAKAQESREEWRGIVKKTDISEPDSQGGPASFSFMNRILNFIVDKS